MHRLCLWGKHEAGEFWMSQNEVLTELEKIPGTGAQRNTIKDQMTIWVKGFGMN